MLFFAARLSAAPTETASTSIVPEPATLGIFGVGLGIMAIALRRIRRKR